MLPRPYRLVKEKDFARVMTKGRGWKMPEGRVKKIVNGLPNNRFGIVVSNKVAKKATVRNKLKRRIREVIRQFLPDLKTGFDVVVVAYPPILEKDFDQIKNLLGESFAKLHLFK